MNNVTQIVRKYRQASWRVQRQWIGLFLVGLVLVAMVAAIYLNITTQANLAGRQIQNIEDDILTNQRANADLETQLAALTSTDAMQKRAQDLGFHPVDPGDITYVVVPGYQPKQPIDLTTNMNPPANAIILPEYSESLFDWFTRELVSSAPSGGQP
jgi:cell division protein FtsL